MLKPRNILFLWVLGAVVVVWSAAARAQVMSEQVVGPPVAYASVNELNNILGQVRQTAQSISTDLSKTRIDKWKADSATKRELQSNVASIQRNLESALPEIITQLNNAPEDLAASFKLYRNLDALYDVFGQVAQSAGAFGSKDEFQNLANDMSAIQSARRMLGDRMQNLAAAKENELSRMRNQLKAAQAAAPPPAPKKVIVDDTEPPKKPAKKKPAKPTPPAGTTTPQPSAPTN